MKQITTLKNQQNETYHTISTESIFNRKRR